MHVNHQLARQEADEWLVNEINQCRTAIQQLQLVRLIRDAVMSLKEVSINGAETMMARMIHDAPTLEDSYAILREYLKQWQEDEIPAILRDPTVVLSNSYERSARDWAVDYKPFEYGLEPHEYAAHGFKRGIEFAMRQSSRY